MAYVYVYPPNADDFDCLGLCGPLTPTKCVHIEDANGMSEIALEQPIDEHGRWSYLQTGYIIKAEVPVRTCPEVTEAGALVTAVEKWRVKPLAPKAQRYLYTKSSGGRKKKLLNPGTVVVVTQKGASRYKAKSSKYNGWIAIEALENKVEQIIPEDPDAIEQVVPAWSVRPQLFRITEAVVGDKSVSVKAQHIFYDLLGNVTTYSANNPTCVAALAGILGGCAVGHEFEGYTNMIDTRIIDAWRRVSPVEALLNPDNGLVARWGGELVRDDYEFYVLNRAGMNRGVRIAYGKNLLGVDCTINQTDVITRIMPIGQTSKGQPLLLAAGTYTVDGQTVTIDSSLTVAADNADDYPTPHVFVLDVGEAAKAVGTTTANVRAARVQMIRAALRKFADEQCNLPSVNLKVNFVALGDTAEYAQYKRLEDVFLYDSVRVYHPRIAIDVTAQVKRVEYDCLLERFNAIELGELCRDMAHTPIASWRLPPAMQIAYGAVGSGALADDVGPNLDLSENGTITPITMVIESSEGAVLKGPSPDMTTTLTARVYRGVMDITGSLDPARFAWARDSGDAEADTEWAADQAGAYAVEVSATEFPIRPAGYRCSIAPIDDDDPTPTATGAIIMQFVQSEAYASAIEPANPPNGFVWYDLSTGRVFQWSDAAGDWLVLADYVANQQEIAALRSGTIDNEAYQALMAAANDITAVAQERNLLDNLAKTLNFGPEGLAMTSLGGEYNMLLGVQSIDFRKGTVVITTFGNVQTITSPILQVGKVGQASRLVLGDLVLQAQANGDIVARKR